MYHTFRESLELARENQPDGWKPEDPPVAPTSFPNDLHFTVQEKLGEKLTNGGGELKLWNARGSFLDRLHGVDAFFTFAPRGKRAREAVVTVDLTLNPQKAAHGGKAEVVIWLPKPYADLSAEEREKILTGAADEVAARIAEQVSSGRSAA